MEQTKANGDSVKSMGHLYYAAFVRDPDGNKLEAVFQDMDGECGATEPQLRKFAFRGSFFRFKYMHTVSTISAHDL